MIVIPCIVDAAVPIFTEFNMAAISVADRTLAGRGIETVGADGIATWEFAICNALAIAVIPHMIRAIVLKAFFALMFAFVKENSTMLTLMVTFGRHTLAIGIIGMGAGVIYVTALADMLIIIFIVAPLQMNATIAAGNYAPAIYIREMVVRRIIAGSTEMDAIYIRPGMRLQLSTEEALMIVQIAGNLGMVAARRGIMGAGGIAVEAEAIARGFIIGMGPRDGAFGTLMLVEVRGIQLPDMIAERHRADGAYIGSFATHMRAFIAAVIAHAVIIVIGILAPVMVGACIAAFQAYIIFEIIGFYVVMRYTAGLTYAGTCSPSGHTIRRVFMDAERIACTAPVAAILTRYEGTMRALKATARNSTYAATPAMIVQKHTA